MEAAEEVDVEVDSEEEHAAKNVSLARPVTAQKGTSVHDFYLSPIGHYP
ncbi:MULTISPECIES: hypothetical protein [unclassified Corynebacterium]|nr:MULTISPECIES: hypothetical protein [unclassified Corynebacterium]KXB52299.1 hypothetical protein HMPREF0307_02364 [Corynebacterium sp. DNF00584]